MDLTALEREDLIEIINNQASHIAGLEKKLAGVATTKKAEPESKASIPVQPVEVLGKRYKFRFPLFKFNGQSCKANEVQYDEALLEKIAKTKGQTILVELSK